MNTMWSQYIQSSEELYRSRELRFRIDNQNDWLPKCRIEDGMQVMEVGCAGGLLLHRIKQLLPHITVTGVDRDDNHIAYAKAKTMELGLDCNFIVGDALDLPFAENVFDRTISHTVIEHVETRKFLKEQYRVLKPGGMIVVLSVRTRLNLAPENWRPMDEEELRLMNKAWSQTNDFDKDNGIGQYELKESDFPRALENAGFKNVNIDFICLTSYAPDNASVSDGLALKQINENRFSCLESMRKALRQTPDSLTDKEQQRLTELIHKRFDERIELYNKGEKLWDIATSTILVATGRKPNA